MENKEIIQRSIKGWKQKISLLEKSGDTADHMRSALRQVAEIVRDEYWVEGNQRLGQNLLSMVPGLDDQQIRELHRKWLSDAQQALKSSEEIAKQLGYSTGSSCFIATAACGELSEEVIVLSLFRDKVLSNIFLGRVFIRIYYAISPSLASLIQSSARTQSFFRKILIHPIASLTQISLRKRKILK